MDWVSFCMCSIFDPSKLAFNSKCKNNRFYRDCRPSVRSYICWGSHTRYVEVRFKVRFFREGEIAFRREFIGLKSSISVIFR